MDTGERNMNKERDIWSRNAPGFETKKAFQAATGRVTLDRAAPPRPRAPPPRSGPAPFGLRLRCRGSEGGA